MRRITIFSSFILFNIACFSINIKPAISGCAWGDITCNPKNWTCPAGGCPPEKNTRASFRITQMGSGRCLTTPDLASDPNGGNNGAKTFLYDCYKAGGSGYNQLWQLQKEGNFFRIVQMGSGRCLTTPDLASDPNGGNNGAKTFLYDCYKAGGSGYNQLWQLQKEGNFFRIVQMGSGRCLTTPDLASDPNGSNNGAKTFLYDCYKAGGSGYNQLWQL